MANDVECSNSGQSRGICRYVLLLQLMMCYRRKMKAIDESAAPTHLPAAAARPASDARAMSNVDTAQIVKSALVNIYQCKSRSN